MSTCICIKLIQTHEFQIDRWNFITAGEASVNSMKHQSFKYFNKYDTIDEIFEEPLSRPLEIHSNVKRHSSSLTRLL